MKCTAGAPFKSSMTVHFLSGPADQNWLSVVFFERSSVYTLQFPSAELFPLHNFQNWDCHCMLVYSFGIGRFCECSQEFLQQCNNILFNLRQTLNLYKISKRFILCLKFFIENATNWILVFSFCPYFP